MPQDVRIKDLHAALSDIEDWVKNVKTAIGSLDPDQIVPMDEIRITPRDGATPIPTPLPRKGVCWPTLRGWPDPFENS